jgi:hypothetical protein
VRAVFILSALSAVASALISQVPIRAGQTVTGRLTQADQKFSDGSRYKLYAFVGNRGDTLTADLSSDDFDANLLIADAAGNSLARNDDGGGQCNARLMFVPPATGNYRLYANSSAQAELGDYKLSLSRGREAAPADTVCKGFGRVAGLIEVGQTVTGSLTSDDPEFSGDSTYFERWILPVHTNQAFTVDLISDDFDAYLLLTRGRGEKLVDNDDGGGGCNARIVYTATDDHPLRVIVNTASRPRNRQTGRFTLRVTEGQSSVETKGNCRFTSNLASNTQTMQQVSTVSQRAGGSGQPVIPTIRVGETINGELTSSDSLYPDTTYFKMYQFTAIPGQPITIDLSADEFDPLLIVRGEDLDRSIIDDDGGPGCYSRISRIFPSAGPYRILVNTTSTPKRQTGHFSLSITQGSKPVQEGSAAGADCRTQNAASAGGTGGGSVAAHSIDVGQTQQGELTTSDVLLTHDSTYAQPWTIHGVGGQTITIDLESDAFDAYLFLRGPGIAGGRDFQDDDSGGNCNARLTATFPQTGDYEIDVNTVGHYATGAFTLSVTTGSKPKSVARCTRSNQ